MLRISLCLLLTAVFVLTVFATQPQVYAQEHTDVQALQFEFGKSERPAVSFPPCSCAKPVVYAPIERGCCYAPCYTPCYSPFYYPARYRHACVRPVYYSPYYYGCR